MLNKSREVFIDPHSGKILLHSNLEVFIQSPELGSSVATDRGGVGVDFSMGLDTVNNAGLGNLDLARESDGIHSQEHLLTLLDVDTELHDVHIVHLLLPVIVHHGLWLLSFLADVTVVLIRGRRLRVEVDTDFPTVHQLVQDEQIAVFLVGQSPVVVFLEFLTISRGRVLPQEDLQ